MPKSAYLEGNFAPVEQEVVADDLPVRGELPRELDGVYVRNGPNPQFAPLGRYHALDGDGMLHGVRIAGGRASYRNRWLRTRALEQERKRGRALFTGLLERPRFDSPDGPNKHAANHGLVWHDGRLLALQEHGEPYHVGVPELDTRGIYTFGRRLRHAVAPHPKLDAHSGELFLLGTSPVAKPHLQYSVVSAAGALTHTTAIDLPIGVWMHDFALTERFAVFMNHPYTFDVKRMLRDQPLAAFEPERGSFLGLLPRRASGSEMRWFAIAPCFAVHTVAAWDDGEAVELVACQRAALRFADDGLGEDELGSSPRLWRWRIELRTGLVRETQLDDQSVEFPTIHPAQVGRKPRFAYLARYRRGVGLPLAHGVAKYELASGVATQHDWGRDRFGGEALFVPREGARDEDDGFLLAFVHDQGEAASELVVLDARDLEASPLARVALPQRVPYGFHGAWIARAALETAR